MLAKQHIHQLVESSAVDPNVVTERGYRTVGWTLNDKAGQRELNQLGIPSWARDAERGTGLLIPMFRATGERISYQWRPDKAVRNRDGKFMRYSSVRGQTNRLDVHPRNTNAIADPTVPLWITEGVKKADALTSRGCCTIALTGVYNWRSQLGTLGDWEDIPLRGRDVTVAFDSDAATNRNVLRAMRRLGAWLRSKGVARVNYLIPPASLGEVATKGLDDYLAAGGTLDALTVLRTTTPPTADISDDTFTDARLAETIADDVLADRFCWAAGLGWLSFDGRRWRDCTDVTVGEAVRQYVLERFHDAAGSLQAGGNAGAVEGWQTMLSAGRERSVLGLARGLVEVLADQFDHDHDLLNTPSGTVDLPTGTLSPHDPAQLMRKITGADYRPGFQHPDWTTALQAVPEDILRWLQVRIGQAITGHTPTDDLLVVLKGGGSNGKSTIIAATAAAAGEYFLMVSDRAIMGDASQHPTELCDFQGARYAVLEELPEARRLDPQRLKRTVGTPVITARRIRQDSITFRATHTLFLATNHVPIVDESDHGTWRRLALVPFPYTFRGPGQELRDVNDRRGDTTLRDRCLTNPDVAAAALAWMIEGTRAWYKRDRVMPVLPSTVTDATAAWRGESDLMFRFWAEHLIADPKHHVVATELLHVLNEWLVTLGAHSWGDKVFSSRFGEHELTTAARVLKSRIRRNAAQATTVLSRPPGSWDKLPNGQSLPSQYQAWAGVRFRTSDDDTADAADEPSTSGNLEAA